jgi:hypothetical protein
MARLKRDTQHLSASALKTRSDDASDMKHFCLKIKTPKTALSFCFEILQYLGSRRPQHDANLLSTVQSP